EGHPSPFDDERHRQWWARYLRMAASPAMAQAVIRMSTQMDLRDLLPKIGVPTLILHRAGDRWIEVGHARYMAERIPGATYVELPGEDHRAWLGDVESILTPVEIFLSGRKHRPRRRATLGTDALSQREREVALLLSPNPSSVPEVPYWYGCSALPPLLACRVEEGRSHEWKVGFRS